MHRDKIRERALEAQHGKCSDLPIPVACDPEAAAAEASKKARPSLSQIEQERADDEGMTRPDDDEE